MTRKNAKLVMTFIHVICLVISGCLAYEIGFNGFIIMVLMHIGTLAYCTYKEIKKLTID